MKSVKKSTENTGKIYLSNDIKKKGEKEERRKSEEMKNRDVLLRKKKIYLDHGQNLSW